MEVELGRGPLVLSLFCFCCRFVQLRTEPVRVIGVQGVRQRCGWLWLFGNGLGRVHTSGAEPVGVVYWS